MGIQVNHLSKEFGTIRALDDVNFSMPQGHIIALVGPNGAGKSTLIRLLTSIMTPTSGSAIIYGNDTVTQADEVKRKTGLLPEESALYDKLTVFEYCEFIGALYDMNKKEIREEFDKLARRLDIHTMEDRLIETLSKGQKQKVSLIVAFLHSPLLLLLDEPMANLDVISQIEVKKMLREYRSQDRSIVIATHLLENVKDLCEMIVVIDKGRIRFVGTLEEFTEGEAGIEDAYLKYFGGDQA